MKQRVCLAVAGVGAGAVLEGSSIPNVPRHGTLPWE